MLSPAEFETAIHEVIGIEYGLPRRETDRKLSDLFKVEEITARRWRLGATPIPGPVELAIELMRQLRDLRNPPA